MIGARSCSARSFFCWGGGVSPVLGGGETRVVE